MMEGDAPLDNDDVGVGVAVIEFVAVPEKEAVGDEVDVMEGDAPFDNDDEGVAVIEFVRLGLGLPDTRLLFELVLELAPAVPAVVGVSVSVIASLT